MSTAYSAVQGRVTNTLFLCVLIVCCLFSTKVFSETTEASAVVSPLTAVDIRIITPSSIRLWSHFSGTLAAVDTANIKPMVGGRIEAVFFEDGARVKGGDPLFLIDPRPYQAIVDRVTANLTSTESRFKLASQELERTKGLVIRKLISQSLFDQSKSEYDIAYAAIAESKSALVQAQIDLDFATIRAPFDGIVSRAELTKGNVVELNGSAPILTVLISESQLYGEFDIDEQAYIKLIRSKTAFDHMPVTLNLSGEKDNAYQGHLHSVDNQLDKATATIRARALFDNDDGVLKPGMYANIHLGIADKNNAFMVPQTAIGTNQSRKFVYLLDVNNIVVYREITLGAQLGETREVLNGLAEGDRVVTNGIAKIRPGMPVNPTIVN